MNQQRTALTLIDSTANEECLHAIGIADINVLVNDTLVANERSAQ